MTPDTLIAANSTFNWWIESTGCDLVLHYQVPGGVEKSKVLCNDACTYTYNSCMNPANQALLDSLNAVLGAKRMANSSSTFNFYLPDDLPPGVSLPCPGNDTIEVYTALGGYFEIGPDGNLRYAFVDGYGTNLTDSICDLNCDACDQENHKRQLEAFTKSVLSAMNTAGDTQRTVSIPTDFATYGLSGYSLPCSITTNLTFKKGCEKLLQHRTQWSDHLLPGM